MDESFVIANSRDIGLDNTSEDSNQTTNDNTTLVDGDEDGSNGNATFVLSGSVSDYDVSLDGNDNVVFSDCNGNSSTITNCEYVHVMGDGESYSMEEIAAYASQPTEEDDGMIYRDDFVSDSDPALDQDENGVIGHDHTHHSMEHTADYLNLISAQNFDIHESGYSIYGNSDQDQPMG